MEENKSKKKGVLKQGTLKLQGFCSLEVHQHCVLANWAWLHAVSIFNASILTFCIWRTIQ